MRRMTFAFLMMLAVSCASPARQSYVGRGQPRVHDIIGGEWNGLSLGMTKDDARLLLGEPYQVNKEELSVGDEFWCYEPCGYVKFSDGRVSAWCVPSEWMCYLLRPT